MKNLKNIIPLLGLLLIFRSTVHAQHDQVWMHPNLGQWDDRIAYKVDLIGGSMLIEKQGFTFLFHNADEVYHHPENNADAARPALKFHAIKWHYPGSNAAAAQSTSKPSAFYRNYFLDNDPNHWKSGVNSFQEVRYADFYPGIDLHLNGERNGFKYAFYVKPGATASSIVMSADGADDIRIARDGALEMTHSFGVIRDEAPKAWNISPEGQKKEVPVFFELIGQTVHFRFPKGYDASQLLVIDPSITFSSYTGSTIDNWGNTATPDDQFNLVGGGIVFGSGYPITTGAYDNSYNGGTTSGGGGLSGFDMGITKFSADGSTFLYSTYLGGSAGNETPMSLISDPAGNVYILGTTSSSNFPMVGAPFQGGLKGGPVINTASGLDYNGTDIVIIHLSNDGKSLLHTTFLGGTGNDGLNDGDLSSSTDLVHNYGDNFRGEIILDQNGDVVIASTTTSSDFPVKFSNQPYGGTQDAIYAKLSSDLSSLLWSTYYGGSKYEAGYGIQLNVNGDLYATGGTNSSGLNVPGGATNALQGDIDGFILRLNDANGTIINGTYVGTTSYDQTYFVQTDNVGDVYVYGQTNGSMTISTGLYGNASSAQFIRKYTSNLGSLVWTTKIGGSSTGTALSPTAFSVSNCREIYLAGWGGNILNSNISNFPTTSDAFMLASSDGDAFWVAVLDKDASALKYATFIGGTSDEHVDGGTSRFDKTGRIYHAVCSSCGFTSNGFVSTPGVAGPNDNSDNCNMAAFKFELNTIKSVIAAPTYKICAPDNVTFTNNSIEGDTYLWDFGDGTTSTLKAPTHFYANPGQYTVTLLVSDSQGCKLPDSTSLLLDIGSFAPGQVDTPTVICPGESYQFNASGGIFYTWSPANVLDNPNIFNPTATVFQTTTFTVIIGDSCGYDSTQVTLFVYPDSTEVSGDTSICVGQSVPLHVSGTSSQVWSPNLFISSTSSTDPIVTPNTSMYYYVDGTSVNGCTIHDSVYVQVFFIPPVGILQDTAQACLNVPMQLNANGAPLYLWSPGAFISSVTDSTVFVTPPVDMYYYCDFINPCGVTRDSVFVNVITPNIVASPDQILCAGDSALLSARGAISYVWTPPDFLNANNLPEVMTTPESSLTYMVVGTDADGCRDTAFVNISLFPNTPVYAGADHIASLGEVVTLTATTDGTGSFVWSPAQFLSCATCQNTYAMPNYNMTYTVTFIDENGCVSTDNVSIIYKGVLYVPNTFTPDGGKFNEVFKVYGEGIDHIEVLIFDRWGEVIATINSMDESWDGTYKGKPCQDGTYTWKLKYTDITGEEKKLVGHVNLIR